jgi:hypothetical protein
VHEEAIQTARELLRKRAWKVFEINNWLGTRTIQPAAKFSLYSAGRREGFYVASEVNADFSKSDDHRIDLVWFDTEEWDPAVGFEIDGGVSQHSVKKLQRMSEASDLAMGKVIVSKSPNPAFIDDAKDKKLPNDFHHIDVGYHRVR